MNRILSVVFILAIIFSSCEKDDHCEAGPEGAQGVAGADGQNGTIKLVTKEITIQQNEWISYNTSANSNDSAAVVMPEITPSIVDSGVVICYRKVGNHYRVMPNSNFNGIGEYVFQHYFYEGKLVITCNANFVGGMNTGTETFKVIIASGELIRLAGPELIRADFDTAVRLLKLK